jgi:hypothetical protein
MAISITPIIDAFHVSLADRLKRLDQLEAYKAQTETHLEETLLTIEVYKKEIAAIKCMLCKFNSDTTQEDGLDSTLVDCESCTRKSTCEHKH